MQRASPELLMPSGPVWETLKSTVRKQRSENENSARFVLIPLTCMQLILSANTVNTLRDTWIKFHLLLCLIKIQALLKSPQIKCDNQGSRIDK